MQTGRLIRTLLMLAVTVQGLGCFTVKEHRVVGTYRAKAPCVTITLTVKPDHSFVQTAQTDRGQISRITGTWSVDKGPKIIIFKPFLDFLSDEGGRQVDLATFGPEDFGAAVVMGPAVVSCDKSVQEADYVK